MAVGNVARRMLGPGRDRAVVVAVERAVVDALGLEEDDRVGVLDGGDQQALGVVRASTGSTTFRPAMWVNRLSGDWLCVWPPKMPPP